MAKEDWRNVEITQLTSEQRALWDAMKAAYQAYAGAKGAFQERMNKDVADKMPKGMELKFGYMFGKLSVTIGPVNAPKAKAVKDEGTLGDWLAGQAASGNRC